MSHLFTEGQYLQAASLCEEVLEADAAHEVDNRPNRAKLQKQCSVQLTVPKELKSTFQSIDEALMGMCSQLFTTNDSGHKILSDWIQSENWLFWTI